MFIVCMFTFSCRRCSSVVEHVIGNDGVASPILASGTIKKPPFVEVFLMVMLQSRTCGGISKSGDRAKQSLAKESKRSENLLVCAVALPARTSLPAAPFLIFPPNGRIFCC